MKTLIKISCMLLLVNLGFSQEQVEMPNWFSLYSKIYHNTISATQLASPSSLAATMNKTVADNNTGQLYLFETEINVGDWTDEQLENMGIDLTKGDPKSKLNVSSLAIVVPNINLISEDGTIDLHFNSIDHFAGFPNRSRIPEIVSVGVYKNNRLLFSVEKGESLTISYLDLFGNLKIRLNYKNGDTKELKFVVTRKPIIFGPNPSLIQGLPTDPINPMDPCTNCEIDCNDCGEQLPPFDPCSSENYKKLIKAKKIWERHPLLIDPLYGVPINPNFPYAVTDYQKFTSGANPGVYEGENPARGELNASYYINPIRNSIQYPIILVDGIDFDSSRDADALLEHFGGHETLQLLFDRGYDLVIADFKGGADYIQKNALALVELIRSLRHDDGIPEIPAILGPSMGGQVVRYALMYWEKNLISDDNYGDYNIPLFVSIDSPWLGANAPPGVLRAAAIADQLPFGQGKDLYPINVLANCPAARQMLIHHYSPENHDNGEYTASSHPWKDILYNEMSSWGDYPKESDIIAIADGANLHPGYGNDPLFVAPGEVIFEKQVEIKNVDWIIEDLKIFSIKEEEKLVQIPTLSDTDTKTALVDGLDSCPGSRFDLVSILQGIEGITVNSSFCFIPTFSALGVVEGLADPLMDLSTPQLNTPFFSETYSNGVNSDHIEMNSESILFVLSKLNSAGFGMDNCEYLEYYFENQGGLFSDDKNRYVVDIFGTPINYTDLIDCPNDMLFSLEYEIELEITENPCGIEVTWDYDRNQPVFNLTEPFTNEEEICSIEINICMSNPECQNFNECETISWQLNFIDIIEENGVGDIPIYIGDINENALSPSDSVTSSFKELKIYPNPSSGRILLELIEGLNQIDIYTIDGKLISSQKIEASQEPLEQNLEKGSYIIKVANYNLQTVEVKRIIVL